MSTAELIRALPEWVLVTGKGGVGKSTTAAALALDAAREGSRTLLLSTDPAGSLGDVLGVSLPPSGSPVAIPFQPGLHAWQLDPDDVRRRLLGRWREALVAAVDRGTYLDHVEAEGLVDATLPGADESMAVLVLAELLAVESGRGEVHRLLELDGAAAGSAEPWTRVIVDTAPTGHTLRLLDAPEALGALADLLDAMQAKHRALARAIARRWIPDDTDSVICLLHDAAAAMQQRLADGNRCCALLVTRSEPGVRAESLRYTSELARRGLEVGAVLVNAIPGPVAAVEPDDMSLVPGAPVFMVPALSARASGPRMLELWAESVLAAEPGSSGVAGEWSGSGGSGGEFDGHRQYDVAGGGPPAAILPRIPRLTIVAGKGGVGKTTIACALALHTARSQPVLLVSTDPAPSLADALGQPIGEHATPVDGAPGLLARQLDARAAFARARERWESDVDRLFNGLARQGGRIGIDASADRAVTLRLLDLAPPGMDELHALAELAEAVESDVTLIVDPAPTGHLLRLLDMPKVALDWTHRLMRILLQHQGLVPLEDVGEALLRFARRIRSLDALLHDPAQAGILIVTLDEPVVQSETIRLADRTRSLLIPSLGIVLNRAAPTMAPEAFRTRWSAPEVVPPPAGTERLLAWLNEWQAHSTSPQVAHA